MRHLYIHIGMHKTGSTSIQKSLRELNLDNIAYMPLGNDNHSAIFSTVFLSEPQFYPAHKRNKRTKDEVEDLRKYYCDRIEKSIIEMNPKSLVSSGEDISLMDYGAVERMRQYFERFFDSINIVGYVRPPASYMSSALQQRLSGGQSIAFETLYPNYRKRFEKFDLAFGSRNVILKKFDKSTLVGGDVVTDFATIIGLEADNFSIDTANKGRSLETAALLFSHRKFVKLDVNYKGAPVDNARLLDAISGIGKRKVQLHNDILEPIILKNNEDILWMEERVSTSLFEEKCDGSDFIKSTDDLLSVSGATLPDLARVIRDLQSRPYTDDGAKEAGMKFLSELIDEAPEMISDLIQFGLQASSPNPKLAAFAVEYINRVLKSERGSKIGNNLTETRASPLHDERS